jgi:uncharacterized protein
MHFENAQVFILERLSKELPANLSYHSLEHIKDVYQAAQRLAELEGITGDNLTLLLTAVLFHDAGFLVQQKDHEQLSCSIARQDLPQFGYSTEQLDVICGMIMATQIPQSPKNKMEEVICDADLDYLGRDDFFEIGNKLFDELCFYGIISSTNEWNKLQVSFLEKHHYFTKSAIHLRQEKKDKHLAMVKSMIQ